MPPKIQVAEERILQQAVKLVRQHGIAALNARSLADALDCSVQPIFRTFHSMGELKNRVTDYIAEDYQRRLKEGLAQADPLNGLLMAYIRYAQEEKQFFRLLHLSDRLALGATGDFVGVGVNKVIVDAMIQETGLSREDAEALYVGSFFAAHGMAAMLATNHCSFSEESIQEIIGNVYEGLLLQLESKRRHEENHEENDKR